MGKKQAIQRVEVDDKKAIEISAKEIRALHEKILDSQ